MRTFIKSTFLAGCMTIACLCAFAQSNYYSPPYPQVFSTTGTRALSNTAGVITSTAGVATPIAATTGSLTATGSVTNYVYWANSGNTLSITTTLATAATAPNVLVATVVAGSSTITSVAMAGNFTPMTYTAITTQPVFLAAAITDITDVANQIWWSQVNVTSPQVISNLCVLTGTATTDSFEMGLWNASGTLVANTLLTGATLSTASRFSCQALVSPAAAYLVQPGTYFLGIQGSATTAASFYVYGTGQNGFGTGSQSGSANVLAAIAPSTVYTASVGPVMMMW